MKEIEIDCPCCQTRLFIDGLTGKIMKTASPRSIDETGKAVLDEGRWDVARTKAKDRSKTSTDVFDRALEEEGTRERDLDDLFDKAKNKLRKRKDGELEP